MSVSFTEGRKYGLSSEAGNVVCRGVGVIGSPR
jgi:hypothetical protein